MLVMLGLVVAAILGRKLAPEHGILNTVLSILACVSVPAGLIATYRTPCPRRSKPFGGLAWTVGAGYNFGADIRCPSCLTHIDDAARRTETTQER
jgi:hypothetical protein